MELTLQLSALRDICIEASPQVGQVGGNFRVLVVLLPQIRPQRDQPPRGTGKLPLLHQGQPATWCQGNDQGKPVKRTH